MTSSCSIVGLENIVQHILANGLRLSTKITYASAQRSFIDFCNQYHLCVIPAREQTLLWYIAHTQSRPGFKALKATTLKVHMAAIRDLHVKSGLPVPPTSTPRVKTMIKAIYENGPGPMRKLPITYNILNHLLRQIGLSPSDLVWHSVLSLGFFGGLRGAEYTLATSSHGLLCPPLLARHITFGCFNGTNYMSVFIPRSKTRPHGFKLSIGCSGTQTCAVCSTHAYFSHRAKLGPIHPDSYAFVLPNMAPLSKSVLNQKIKCLVASIGLDSSQYSSHSLRTGVATTAAIAGFNEVQVKAIAGWTSQAYTLYIRNVQFEQIGFAKRLTIN